MAETQITPSISLIFRASCGKILTKSKRADNTQRALGRGHSLKMKLKGARHIKSEEGVSVKVYRHGSSNRHSHEFVELVYVLDGHARHVVGNEVMDVKKGDVILMDAGVEHEFATEKDERITLCNCLFYPEFLTRVITGDNFIDLAYDMFFSGYEDERGAKGYLCLLGADTSEIGRLVLTMVDEQEKKQEGYLKVIRSLLSVVLIKTFRLCENENRPTIPSAQRKIVSEIIDYVTAHDSKSLSVGVISHAMFFSPSYLSRIFKQQTGKSLVSFIQAKKIETAAELLRSTSYPVEKIMLDVGYADKKHFYEVFAAAYGTTPGEYRASGSPRE